MNHRQLGKLLGSTAALAAVHPAHAAQPMRQTDPATPTASATIGMLLCSSSPA